MPGRDDMRGVELVEPEDHEPAPARPVASGVRGAAWPARARRWWPVAVVVLAALAVTQVALDRRDQRALARLAAVPGVLHPVGTAPTEQWRSGLPPDLTGAAAVTLGGGLVAARTDAAGVQTVDLVDLDTGAVRWSATLTGPDAVAANRPGRLVPHCLPAAGSARPTGPVLVCLVQSSFDLSYATVDPTSVAPRSARVVTLDPVSGAVLADRPTAASSSLAVLDGLAVVAWVARDAHGEVTASDPVTGHVRWSFSSPAPMPARPGESLAITVTVVGAHVVARSASANWWVLAADGSLVLELPGSGAATAVAEARGGRLVTTGAGPGRTGRTTLLADDGPGPELIGYPVHLTVDDGSAAGLVFTSGPSLAGWDPGTGDRRWLGTTTGVTDAVLLGGTLYAAAAGRLVAVDATTGRVRWDVARAASGTGAALLTDGRQLLTLDPGARPRLLRTALDDGRTIGSTDLAPGVQGLVGADGHLVALDRADGLVLVLG